VRTREELRLSDHRYRGLIEQAPAVSYIARWADGFRFVYVSPQIEDLLGFPAERFMAEPGSSDREYRLIRADGCVVWV
jgi:PAS domain-containing protein